jgi:hypothetical protein
MPTVPPYIIEPIWEQFRALLPERAVDYPLGCHRVCIPDRTLFEKRAAPETPRAAAADACNRRCRLSQYRPGDVRWSP